MVGTFNIFRATYQDKGLNKTQVEFESLCWADAIIAALEKKRADQKLILLEFVREGGNKFTDIKKERNNE